TFYCMNIRVLSRRFPDFEPVIHPENLASPCVSINSLRARVHVSSRNHGNLISNSRYNEVRLENTAKDPDVEYGFIEFLNEIKQRDPR
ncbi:hypothetical protein L9F63_023959, partial [Diploptera punctata]